MLKLRAVRGVEHLAFKVEGGMPIGAGSIPVDVSAAHPLMDCAENTASAARTVAAQIYAKYSDQLRREFIHNMEMTLREVMKVTVPLPVTKGVNAELRKAGDSLDIRLRRDGDDGEREGITPLVVG